MRIDGTQVEKGVVYLITHESGQTGNSAFTLVAFDSEYSRRDSYGFIQRGFSPIPRDLDPNKTYLAAEVSSFYPNGNDSSLRRQGNGSALLDKIREDARSLGAEVLVFNHVCNQEMRDFLVRRGFFQLPRGKYMIKI
jgi:GNAT superfamily N-acetyltransferase